MYQLEKCLSGTFFIILSISVLKCSAQLDNDTSLEVTILQGTLRGTTFTTHYQRNVSGFLGIPYAEPPVGDLRFANPVRAGNWTGIRNASVDMNACPQELIGIPYDEDCLYLNVYTPQLPASTNAISLLPVMVYIHGGSFVTGSGRSDSENPAYLLDSDVVLVIPNYRLGALGFLSTGDEVASGNWALKDQIMALEWVQNNIAYFGGDPDQVTLFGLSVGGASVHLLTLSNATNGLFHRYITQSGSALAPWAHQPRAYYASRAFELGEYVGCQNETSESLIKCLRTISSSDILDSRSQFLRWGSFPPIIWSPTDEPDIEGAVLTDSPANLFANGAIRDLPWICSVVRDEGLIHSIGICQDEDTVDDFMEKIDTILPMVMTVEYHSDSGAAWTEAVKSHYLSNYLTANKTELCQNITQLIGDALFNFPAYNGVRKQLALANNPEYFYSFNYRGTYSNTDTYGDYRVNYGVAHGDDFYYHFPPKVTYSTHNKTFSETDLEMMQIMVQIFTNFAINGTPTSFSSYDSTTKWDPYSIEDNYVRIGNESDLTIETEYSYFKERMEFWIKLTDSSTTTTTTTTTSAAINLNSNSFIVIMLFIFSKFILITRTDSTLV